MKRTRTTYRCDNPKCRRPLYRNGEGRPRWITGQDRRITEGKRNPRYCWPGEGCHK